MDQRKRHAEANARQMADQKRRNAAADAEAKDDPAAAGLLQRRRELAQARLARKAAQPTTAAERPSLRVIVPARSKPKPVEKPAAGANEAANLAPKSSPRKRT